MDTLSAYIGSMRLISSHNHHLPDKLLENACLETVFSNSYVNWGDTGRPATDDTAGWDAYILRNRTRSWFRWLYAAIEELYGLPVCGRNISEIDARVRTAYADPLHHLRILSENCRFDRLINERQPDPGSDLGHPGLFSPSFRCDCFFSGYIAGKPEPNGFLPRSLFSSEPKTLAEYLTAMRAAIGAKIHGGCSALKVAIAYERPIDFDTPDYSLASLAYDNVEPSPQALKAFGDAVMFAVADEAARLGVPLQIHTGTGQYDRTNPIGLLRLIRSNPRTHFHLLHGGFPWLDDTYALLLAAQNVWSDICWIPYLSTTAAEEYIIRALEVAGPERLTWGCDTWMSEDSLGALMAMEHALTRALTRMKADGSTDDDYNAYIARRILRGNANELFRLGLD